MAYGLMLGPSTLALLIRIATYKRPSSLHRRTALVLLPDESGDTILSVLSLRYFKPRSQRNAASRNIKGPATPEAV